jgi:hypothetical protein
MYFRFTENSVLSNQLSVFGSWRTSVAVEEVQKFHKTNMRENMVKATGNLNYQLLPLVQSIAYHYGIYNPMLGPSEKASFWAQV